MNHIGNYRVVWIYALLALARKECMMPFTYEIQLDTMDTKGIRNLACSPWRLSRGLMGKISLHLTPRFFTLSQGTEGPPPQFAVYLVPGGRWLVHTDRGENPVEGTPSRISCSDIALMGTPGDPQPSVHFDLQHATESWPTLSHVQSDPENNRIVVVISYMDNYPK